MFDVAEGFEKQEVQIIENFVTFSLFSHFFIKCNLNYFDNIHPFHKASMEELPEHYVFNWTECGANVICFLCQWRFWFSSIHLFSDFHGNKHNVVLPTVMHMCSSDSFPDNGSSMSVTQCKQNAPTIAFVGLPLLLLGHIRKQPNIRKTEQYDVSQS